jgi:hypothetical protein
MLLATGADASAESCTIPTDNEVLLVPAGLSGLLHFSRREDQRTGAMVFSPRWSGQWQDQPQQRRRNAEVETAALIEGAMAASPSKMMSVIGVEPDSSVAVRKRREC